MATLVVMAVLCASPATELSDAAADIAARVPLEKRPGVRYASFYSLPVEQRGEAAAVLNFVLNTVSRAKVIVAIEVVPDTEQRLWRIDWDRYELPRDAWEALASEDPFWHQRLQSLDAESSKAREVFIDGPWLPPAGATALRAHTRSAGALLRGDFLIARMSTTLDGGHYYRLAGIPDTEQQYLRGLGIDTKAIGKLGADAGANLVFSRVTRKVRRIVRRPGPLGGAWHTYDVERSLAASDPLRNPFDFRYDAGEHIAAAPNGLHRFALYDAQGKRQDSVPDRIAKDANDPHGAGIIAPMISCVRCHVEDGLRPFANDQAKLLAGNVDLLTARPGDAARLADFYGSDLAVPLARDREDYATAVAQSAGGMMVKDAAAKLAALYAGYVDELVTQEQAAREVGVPSDLLVECLRESNDIVLLMLAEGIAVQRDQWNDAYAEAATRVARQQSTSTETKP